MWFWDRGVRATGGLIDRSKDVTLAVGEEKVAAGPVLTGEIERARSV